MRNTGEVVLLEWRGIDRGVLGVRVPSPGCLQGYQTEGEIETQNREALSGVVFPYENVLSENKR